MFLRQYTRRLAPVAASRVLLACFAISLMALPALAQESRVEVATRIYNSVMSPYCPGVTLSSCTSGDARKLREEINGWLAEGSTEGEVRQRLIERYGAGVLGMPERSGLGAVGWLIPPAAMLLGLGVLFFALRRMSAPQAEATAAADSPEKTEQEADARLMETVEADVRKRMI